MCDLSESYRAVADAHAALYGALQYMESQSREELFKDFAEGGRYADTTAIFHSAFSSKLVGQPDKELIDALPASCKWLAHKGAGYDSVDVHAAKARGGWRQGCYTTVQNAG